MSKAKPLKVTDIGFESCAPQEATHLMLHLPGPLPNRILPVMTGGRRKGTGNWTWNGSVDMPTVRPSVLSRGADVNGEHVCHSWINDGKVQFLGDCSHELAGKTVDLLDVD